MPYTYRFYRFASHTEFAARWAEAGLPLADGAPVVPAGALDEIGAVTVGDPPEPLPGWHVNVAWTGEAPGALESYAIQPFDGLRVFAGWADAMPPEPVPEQIDMVQARIILMRDGRFDAVDAACKLAGGELFQFWDYSNKVYRFNSPNMQAMAAVAGYDTEAEIDDFFRRAATVQG